MKPWEPIFGEDLNWKGRSFKTRGWSIEDQRLATWWYEEGFEGESSRDTWFEEALVW